MTVQAIHTDITQLKKIHRQQRKHLKERIEKVKEKGDLLSEAQKDHLRHRIKELSPLIKSLDLVREEN
ncbi:hypothetical protein [Gallibacterium salpingitidis]|uniref:Uncharacterized protein n=1 Tax=Gallibacterium salpingitidis TaxID=505341 RepID=A0A1A7NZJ2_9PAST|nr:hypothetical protein [Gallibacterium salpingitidis]OBW94906.1 hypothetical protein QS62_05140 [Gallibacterium salpingitidis]